MKAIIFGVLGFLFLESKALATESKLIVQCTGSHAALTVVNIFEVVGSEGLAQVNIVVTSGNGEEEGSRSREVYQIQSMTKNSRPLKLSAYSWALRKSAEAIENDQFYGFLFVTAKAYTGKTLYLNLQRYEGSAPNLMVIEGQVEELSCRSVPAN